MSAAEEDSLLEKSEHVLSLVERLMHWQTVIISITAAGVLWGARLEFKISDHHTRLAKLEQHDEKLSDLVTTLRSDNLLLRQLVENMRRSDDGANTNRVDVKVGAMVNTEADKEAAEHRGYFTTAEAANLLKKSERTVQALCAAGKIPGASQPEGGRGWRIPLTFLLGLGDDGRTGSGKSSLTAANNGTPQPNDNPTEP